MNRWDEVRNLQTYRSRITDVIEVYDYFVKDHCNQSDYTQANRYLARFRVTSQELKRLDSKPTSIIQQSVANLIALIMPKGIDSIRVRLKDSYDYFLNPQERAMATEVEAMMSKRFRELLKAQESGFMTALRESVSNYVQYGFTLLSFEEVEKGALRFLSFDPYLTFFYKDEEEVPLALGGLWRFNMKRNIREYEYRIFEKVGGKCKVSRVISNSHIISSSQAETLGTSSLQNFFVATKGSPSLFYGDGDGLQALPHIITCNKLQAHLLYATDLMLRPPIMRRSDFLVRSGEGDGKIDLRPEGDNQITQATTDIADLSNFFKTIIDPNSYNFEALGNLYNNSILAIQTSFSEEALSQLNKYSTATEVESESQKSVNQIQGKVLNLNSQLINPLLKELFKLYYDGDMFSTILSSELYALLFSSSSGSTDLERPLELPRNPLKAEDFIVEVEGFMAESIKARKASEIASTLQLKGLASESKMASAQSGEPDPSIERLEGEINEQ